MSFDRDTSKWCWNCQSPAHFRADCTVPPAVNARREANAFYKSCHKPTQKDSRTRYSKFMAKLSLRQERKVVPVSLIANEVERQIDVYAELLLTTEETGRPGLLHESNLKKLESHEDVREQLGPLFSRTRELTAFAKKVNIFQNFLEEDIFGGKLDDLRQIRDKLQSKNLEYLGCCKYFIKSLEQFLTLKTEMAKLDHLFHKEIAQRAADTPLRVFTFIREKYEKIRIQFIMVHTTMYNLSCEEDKYEIEISKTICNANIDSINEYINNFENNCVDEERLQELEELLMCRVCYANPRNIMLGCQHCFCKSCISHENVTLCPMCRMPITKADMRDLY